ncbi:MAG: LPS export ABC transporter periplasmic protein LptC [Spirochaetales bacterium]|nr:LPS export ABC transporter periplasmic protein LptC [Spirochaetales bacterium]
MNPRSIVFLSLCSLTLLSCEDDGVNPVTSGQVADTVLENLVRVTVTDGERTEIRANRASAYNDEDKTILEGVELKSMNDEGELIMEAQAARVEVRGEDQARAQGAVQIQDIAQDARLSAEVLVWDGEERTLEGEGPVSIDTGDGFSATGEGFSADLARETYGFNLGVEGKWDTDEE